MEQMTNFADSLIYTILNYSLFFLYYGVIFYIIGFVIFWIVKALYHYFSPTWKKWYQAIKNKFK